MHRSLIAYYPTSRFRVGFVAIVFVFIVGLCGALGPAPVHALSLNIVGEELRGASGVLVDGTLYNVTFRDGTCVDLFNGCDQVEDLPFTAAGAQHASEALFDQVFLDQFDTHPELTRGCGDLTFCRILTPFDSGIVNGSLAVATNEAFNRVDVDTVIAFQIEDDIPAFTDTQRINSVTWAQWAPSATGGGVPEPSTILLLATGLLGLVAGARWRQRRAEGHQVG